MSTNGNPGQEVAQDSLSPLEKEVKEWEARQKIAEAEKAIIEANQAKLKAQIPSGSTKPAEGKITTDEKSGYAAELAAYKAMRKKAEVIADIIKTKCRDSIGGILLVDSLDYSGADVQLLQISTQIDSLHQLLEKQINKLKDLIGIEEKALTPEAKKFFLPGLALPVLSVLPQAISAAADVLGYFRMDYDVKGKTINKSDTAFRSMVAGCIPYPVYLSGFHNIENSPLLNRFNQCVLKRNTLLLSIAQLNKIISTAKAAEREAGEGKEKKKPSREEMLCAESEELVKEFDEFGKSISSVSAGNNYSPLANAVIREHLNEYMKKKEITHLLYLTITSAGGEEVTGHGPFSLCGKIWYMGGCVVTYILADMNGKIISSDTIFESSYVHYSLWAKRLSEFKTSSDYLKLEKGK